MYAALAQRRAVKTFLGASYIPEVLAVVEVPGGSMADHLASVVRLFQHRLAPERRRHRIETDRREELIGEAEHRRHIVALSTQSTNNMPGTGACLSQRASVLRRMRSYSSNSCTQF